MYLSSRSRALACTLGLEHVFVLPWTLKRLIRTCHVSEPGSLVRGILRLRDPETGARECLPQAQTWDRMMTRMRPHLTYRECWRHILNAPAAVTTTAFLRHVTRLQIYGELRTPRYYARLSNMMQCISSSDDLMAIARRAKPRLLQHLEHSLNCWTRDFSLFLSRSYDVLFAHSPAAELTRCILSRLLPKHAKCYYMESPHGPTPIPSEKTSEDALHPLETCLDAVGLDTVCVQHSIREMFRRFGTRDATLLVVCSDKEAQHAIQQLVAIRCNSAGEGNYQECILLVVSSKESSASSVYWFTRTDVSLGVCVVRGTQLNILRWLSTTPAYSIPDRIRLNLWNDGRHREVAGPQANAVAATTTAEH